MISNLCRICLSSIRCKYCIDYGKAKGERLYIKFITCDPVGFRWNILCSNNRHISIYSVYCKFFTT